MVRRTGWLLAGCIVACGIERTDLAWPQLLEGEVAFVAAIGPAGPRVAHGPFIASGDLPVVRELLADDHQLAVLFIGLEVLRQAVPTFDRARLSELRLVPPSKACRSLHGEGSVRLTVDDTIARAVVWTSRGFESTSAAELSVALELPTDADRCLGGLAPTLVPFGEDQVLLPEDMLPAPAVTWLGPDRQRWLTWSRHLGEQRLLATSQAGVFVFERGRTFEPNVDQFWSVERWQLPELEEPGWKLEHAVVDPDSNESSAHLYVVLVLTDADGEVTLSDVVELLWTPAGFEEPRLLLRSAARVRRLHLSPRFGLIALGDDGALFTRTTTTGGFESVESGRIEWSDAAPGPSEAEPLVLLDGAHGLHFGIPGSNQPLRYEANPLTLGGARTLTAVDVADEGRFYLSDLDSAELVLRDPRGAHEVVTIWLPESLAECGGIADGCGRVRLEGGRLALAATPRGTVVIAPSGCARLLEFHPTRGCVRALPGDVAPWRKISAPQGFGLGMSGGRLSFTGLGIGLEAQFRP